MGGHRPFLLGPLTAEWLQSRLYEKGDLTIRELTSELSDWGIIVTPDTVWRSMRRQGLSFKKNADAQGAGWREAGAVPGTVESPSGPC